MRKSAALLAAVVMALVLTSCAGFDDVLVRQVFAYKDPLIAELTSIEGTTAEDYAASIRSENNPLPATFWDGRSDPKELNLAGGGAVVWDVSNSPTGITLSAIISSGPRDAQSDPLSREDGPYFGAPSVYTCFTATASVPSKPAYGNGFAYEELDCPRDLTDSLGPGSLFVSILEFSG